MITAIILGAIALGIMGAARQQSGVGAVKAKRRIFTEMAAVQQAGINLSDKFTDLTSAQVKQLEALVRQFHFTGSTRSSKTVAEQFYNSIRRMYNAISGIGSTKLPARDVSYIFNDRGDQIMQYIDYGTQEQIFEDAKAWFYDALVATGQNGFYATIYYIATGGKFRWDDNKRNGEVVSMGVKNSILSVRGDAAAERKMRISYLKKDGSTPDQFAHSVWESGDGSGDLSYIRDGVLDALLQFVSVGQCQQYILENYYSSLEQQDYVPEEIYSDADRSEWEEIMDARDLDLSNRFGELAF